MREKRIDAVIGGVEEMPGEGGYAPTGPAPRPTKLAEHRQPAFYRLRYVTADGATHSAWRLADCDKHAVDLILPLGRVIRLARFATRQELLDALPPARSIRSILPPADLRLAHQIGLLLETDIR